MTPAIRPYRPDDLTAAQRMWSEAGWGDSERHREAVRRFLDAGNVSVALLDGEPEALGHWAPGAVRYGASDVSMAGITAVLTSRVARRRGFASHLTAKALREAAEAGHTVALIGVFDHGFYDRLGFGTGTYDISVTFDPASLRVPIAYRTPRRLTTDDWAAVQQALVRRRRIHGGAVLDPPGLLQAELAFLDDPFGLGYFDGDDLTHFLFGSAKGEHGPYDIVYLAYRDENQLLELLRLLAELSDQVASVSLLEPPEIALADLLDRPVRHKTVTENGRHEAHTSVIHEHQVRLLDVPNAVRQVTWPGPEVEFILELSDPAAPFLEGGWSGVAGAYAVTLGAESNATPLDRSGSGPRLEASVGAFSRMWFGVRSASSLAVTDRLAGSTELLAALDRVFRFGRPVLGWPF